VAQYAQLRSKQSSALLTLLCGSNAGQSLDILRLDAFGRSMQSIFGGLNDDAVAQGQ
jgi:hypothetical protein